MDWSEQKLYALKQAIMTEELWVVIRRDGYAAIFIGRTIQEVRSQANRIWAYPNETKLLAYPIQDLEV